MNRNLLLSCRPDMSARMPWLKIKKELIYSKTRSMKNIVVRIINKEENIQQIWDLNHFDYPERLNPFTEQFVESFAEYGKECIRFLRRSITDTLYIVPFNEISFFSLIAGEWGVWSPYTQQRGYELKKQLVKATIKCMDAIWSVDKDVRFIQVDPIFYRRAKHPLTKESITAAREFKEIKMQAWDMLAGRLEPQLGGSPKYLDIIGCNYYYYNQEFLWSDPSGAIRYKTMGWNSKYRLSLATMLKEVYDRYHRPLLLTETGGWGELRRIWWRRTFREVEETLKRKIPLYGICAYPIVDRPDWTDEHLTNSGLWDFAHDDATCRRIPHSESIRLVTEFSRRHSGVSSLTV
jgi:beta-glucosidase/6-phospho-beta-glucosidase/beta-galactosidase